MNWCAPVRAELGIEVALPTLNGAQRQRRMTDTGVSLPDAYAAVVAETRDTYAASAAEVTR
jgi:carboxylate-amine ligase